MLGRWRLTLWLMAGCGRIGFDGADVTDDGAIECGPGSEAEYVTPAPPPTAKWIAPGGSNLASGTSKAEAWATFAYAIPLLQPGDTLVLADGTYSESMRVDVSGLPGNPITIRAETDGRAIIDGGATEIPCRIDHPTLPVRDLVLEGIQCRNGFPNVVEVEDAARVTLRRISAYDAESAGVLVYIRGSSEIIIEDTAASGSASVVYQVTDSNRVTLRRAWAHWSSSTDQFNADFALLDTNESVIENSVGTMDPSANIDTQGIQINASPGSGMGADRNLVFGNVIRDPGAWGLVVASPDVRIENNRVIDNVLLGGRGGIFQRADAAFRIEHQTVVGQTAWTSSHANPTADAKDADFVMSVHLANSIFLDSPEGISVTASSYQGAITLESNNLFSVAAPYAGIVVQGPSDTAIDPGFDTAQLGLGAYLRGPTRLGMGANGQRMGARVLHRSTAGALTTEPLWPWPMEARIRSETGRSVTWEASGGIWKTLCGVY